MKESERKKEFACCLLGIKRKWRNICTNNETVVTHKHIENAMPKPKCFECKLTFIRDARSTISSNIQFQMTSNAR